MNVCDILLYELYMLKPVIYYLENGNRAGSNLESYVQPV